MGGESKPMSEPLRAVIIDAQNGESWAVERIVAEFSDLIRQECSKYGLWQHPEWSHADLYQEAMVHVLGRIGQFSGIDSAQPRAAFEQWVRVTTKNWLSNSERFRTAKKRYPENGFTKNDGSKMPYDDVPNAAKTASSIFARDEEADRLREAMEEHLDGQEKEVLLLRVAEGLSLKEISSRLSLSYDQVRYKYEKSLAELQKHLGQ